MSAWSVKGTVVGDGWHEAGSIHEDVHHRVYVWVAGKVKKILAKACMANNHRYIRTRLFKKEIVKGIEKENKVVSIPSRPLVLHIPLHLRLPWWINILEAVCLLKRKPQQSGQHCDAHILDFMLRVTVHIGFAKTVLVYVCCPRVINRAPLTIKIFII